ncbi:hypothetical protein FRC07_003148 [Ceratobasidium sp. 392]|nr:hypothetical protein FRC07_003148 [Ceratobasidium sp. 392]
MSTSVTPQYTVAFDKEATLADVYLPSPSGNRLLVPAVLYWHGGGTSIIVNWLSCGDRRSYLPVWFITKLLDKGYAFISADYRLLPPCTGHEILQDVLSFVNWAASPNGLNSQLREKDEAVSVDTTRLAVAGTSSGGYLAYLAAVHARTEHPLRGVLSMYGMGGSFLPKSRPFFRGRPLLDPAQFEQLLSTSYPPPVVSGSPLEYGPDGIPSSPRMFVTRVLLQEGLFLDYLTGDHGLSGRLRAQEEPTISHIPKQHRLLFPGATVSSNFPPTCLVHGTQDSAVLIEESRAMRNRLEHIGVKRQLFEVEGAEHSFDYTEGHEEVLGEVFQVVEGWFEA